jgi:geranylgeranyl reductase
MKMISPSNREVDVGRTLSETEYIGMCRREVMDDFMRRRANAMGATLVNGLMMGLEKPTTKDGMYVLNYNDYSDGSKVRVERRLKLVTCQNQPPELRSG